MKTTNHRSFFEAYFGKYAEMINDAYGTAHITQFDIGLRTKKTREGKIHILNPTKIREMGFGYVVIVLNFGVKPINFLVVTELPTAISFFTGVKS